ncbi:hypothetical protein [Allocoleopsis sp.]|uniref:hypothetical protein n=1 Tax=Allocoleopsis sp. TaxID=3088169 RepID=UPI002FD33D22
MFPQSFNQQVPPLLLAQLDALTTDRIDRSTRLQQLLMATKASSDTPVNYDQIENILEALPESLDKLMLYQALAELQQAQKVAHESMNSLEDYLYQVPLLNPSDSSERFPGLSVSIPYISQDKETRSDGLEFPR